MFSAAETGVCDFGQGEAMTLPQTLPLQPKPHPRPKSKKEATNLLGAPRAITVRYGRVSTVHASLPRAWDEMGP